MPIQTQGILLDGNLGGIGPEGVGYVPLLVGTAQSGSFSTIVADGGNTGDGTAVFTGEPYGSSVDDFVLEATTAGAAAVAAWRYSLDGGVTWSDDDAWQSSGSGVATEFLNGLSITLTDGATPWAAGDQFTSSWIGSLRPNTPTLVNRESYLAQIISGKLADACERFFNLEVPGRGLPQSAYVIRPTNDVAGSIINFATSQTGSGTIALSGTPTVSADFKLEIVQVAGEAATAKYRYTLNGGLDWSVPIVTPASATPAYLGNGISVTFTDGAPVSFQIGDYVTATFNAPSAADPLTALYTSTSPVVTRDSVKYLGKFGYIAILEETDYDDWLNLQSVIEEIWSQQYFVWAMASISKRTGATTVADWALNRKNEAEVFYYNKLALVGSWFETNKGEESAVAWLAGKYSALGIDGDAGTISDGPLPFVTTIVDLDDFRPYRQYFDEAKIVYAKDHSYRDGFYFNSSYLSSSDSSSYQRIYDIRLVTAVLRSASFKAQEMISKTYLASDEALFSIGKEIEQYIINQLGATFTNISVQVLSTVAEVRTTKKLRLKFLVLEKVLIEEIELTVGKQQLI